MHLEEVFIAKFENLPYLLTSPRQQWAVFDTRLSYLILQAVTHQLVVLIWIGKHKLPAMVSRASVTEREERERVLPWNAARVAMAAPAAGLTNGIEFPEGWLQSMLEGQAKWRLQFYW